ncbi:hypothetical protein [Microlunatus soli]|uniref:Uncharacterized protein n=1 Tax=Microlunatus soli TaxID=630515 RepID=A0A1H1MRF4_9ACTN|nr:hypothetical protein [Microlunatus soli]SDR88955.1 hypothetical protein SAMN04489812_0219 [Microlunatus soli]
MYLVAHKEVETPEIVRYGLYDGAEQKIGELVFDPVSGFVVHDDDDRPVVGFVGIAARLVLAHQRTGATPAKIVHTG